MAIATQHPAQNPGPAPRGWNKPVKAGALIVVASVVLLLWLALAVIGTLYFYGAWEARFTLRDQEATLRLPAGMKALAEVTSPVRTKVDARPAMTLRIDQPMDIAIHDSLTARASLRTTLPIDTTVHVDVVVPVQTTLDLSVSIKSWLPRVAVKLPLTLSLPVRMDIPFKTDLPVALDVDATGQLPERMTIPVRGEFRLRPHVRGLLDVRTTALTRFSLDEPLYLPDVRIVHADIRLPMSLGLHHRQPRAPDREN